MIRQTLSMFLIMAGLGGTLLTVFLLTDHGAVVQDRTFADSRYERRDNYDQRYDRRHDRIDRDDRYEDRRNDCPSCGDPYQHIDRESYYQLNRWHHNYVRYGGATVTLKHKVTFDHHRNQYRYDYKIDYNGSRKVLMHWDVLDRMRSENINSSCVLELTVCKPHSFTMWANEPPIMHDGQIQIYNNRGDWDSLNYWRSDWKTAQSGPVPRSYPNEWWPRGRVKGSQVTLLEAN